MSEDTYGLGRIQRIEAIGLKSLDTPFGAGRLYWHHASERWCRYCGARGHVWRSAGEDYYHDETTICTICGNTDCCYQPRAF